MGTIPQLTGEGWAETALLPTSQGEKGYVLVIAPNSSVSELIVAVDPGLAHVTKL